MFDYIKCHTYHPVTKKILEENQCAYVQRIQLCRSPFSDVYLGVLDLWMNGELRQRMTTPLYHLSMCATLSNGKTIRVEKNPIIHFEENPSGKEESKEIRNLPLVTFGELLEKTRRNVGDKEFFSYSLMDNNCGHFIERILITNGLNSPKNQAFLYQNLRIFEVGHELLCRRIHIWTDLMSILSYYSIDSVSILSHLQKNPNLMINT
jgi:hypothetical protein